MHPKSYYEEEIRRRRLEGDQGDGVSLAELEAEFAKYFGDDPQSSSENRTKNTDSEPGTSGGGVLPPKPEPYSDQTEEIPEAVREQTPYYAIDGRPYDEFFGAIEGGMRGASRHGKLGVDRTGKVYAREGMSDVDKRLVELKWEYENKPERRSEIAAEAARLRAQHEGEYTVTEDMPLSHFQLLESDFLKELEKSPPKLEAPPVPEEEIRAVFDEEFSDEPQFRNAPPWQKGLPETDDPVILEGRAEGERILEEILKQYTSSENPSAFDKFGVSTFESGTPKKKAEAALQSAKDDPEILLNFLDIAPAIYLALKQGDPKYISGNNFLNWAYTIGQVALEDTIKSNGMPGPFVTLFSQKSKNIEKAQKKLDRFSEKEAYQKLGPELPTHRKIFAERIEKKIEDIKHNMPQKYDDLGKDKKYREALLEPLYYTLLINEHFDEIYAQLE